MKSFFIIFLAIVLCACNSTPENKYATPSVVPEQLIQESLFPAAADINIESEEDIYRLSDEMKKVVHSSFIPERSNHNRAMKLVKHIFSSEQSTVAYQSNANLTASEAYRDKTANCMSLTIMAYALAKEAGLNVRFQDVQVPEYWVRNGQYNMLTGHVNLVITGVKNPLVSVVWGNNNIEIDFDPFIKKKQFPKRKISRDTVTAMFYNNKGAQALVRKDYDEAFRYFTAAIDVDENYPASWGNLGILYRFTNHNTLAEKTYRHAIGLSPSSLNTMTNLAILLEKQQRYDESRRLDSLILKQRIKNPYYHALLADEAFYAGNKESAVRHYKRGIKVNPKVHELYYGLAKVLNAMGRTDQAKLAMKKAINANKIPSIEREYIAKLSLLNEN
ncbi:tetratricopeptide repeat protein [Thalassotalea euphylliae]|uniref:tetratricopeptide repeat protein n=1 Tax=Thalassotalea euphylliae TaxID=1655234 RepID=UPI00363F651E